LPYQFGKIEYRNDFEHECRGRVETNDGSFRYCATLTDELASCAPETLDEFLLERYTAFTQSGNRRRFFRIWHEPWQQGSAKLQIAIDDLIRATGCWRRHAHCIDANYSPGVKVWMGWPHNIENFDRHVVVSTGAQTRL
jgi:uncharacterized protein